MSEFGKEIQNLSNSSLVQEPEDDEIPVSYSKLSTFSLEETEPIEEDKTKESPSQDSEVFSTDRRKDLDSSLSTASGTKFEGSEQNDNSPISESYDYYFQQRKQQKILSVERPLTVRRRNFTKPPEILERLPNLVELMEGDLLELISISHGIPKPTAKWFKDGSEIQSDDFRIHIIGDNDNYCLYVENVIPADSGVYKIQLENEHGAASTSSCVQVTPLPSGMWKAGPFTYIVF